MNIWILYLYTNFCEHMSLEINVTFKVVYIKRHGKESFSIHVWLKRTWLAQNEVLWSTNYLRVCWNNTPTALKLAFGQTGWSIIPEPKSFSNSKLYQPKYLTLVSSLLGATRNYSSIPYSFRLILLVVELVQLYTNMWQVIWVEKSKFLALS